MSQNTFDEEGNLTSQKSGGIVADALEADGEDEIVEETDLVELEETGVLELESPASGRRPPAGGSRKPPRSPPPPGQGPPSGGRAPFTSTPIIVRF